MKARDIEEASLIADLHQQVQDGIQELRRLSRGLRPIYLEDLGLIPAIEMLARDTQEALNIPVTVNISGKEQRLSNQVELTIYRLVQESLANISRHAQASGARITLAFKSSALELTVQDDGKGFDPPTSLEKLTSGGHYGLMGMQERADSIGGELKIDSSLGVGTTVQLSVPINRG